MRQGNLFDQSEVNNWQDHWKEMPEYDNKIQEEPFITAVFKFRNQDDFDQFNDLIKKYVYKTDKVFDGMQRKDKKSAWYPLNEKMSNYRYVDESEV